MNNPNYMIRDAMSRRIIDRDDQPTYTSMVYGLALEDSNNGLVEVKILGNGENASLDFIHDPLHGQQQGLTGDERGVCLPTTSVVERGDIVLITTHGQTERRMIITGVVGQGDAVNNQVNKISHNMVDQSAQIYSIQNSMKMASNYWGEPVMDGTNLLKNSSFTLIENNIPRYWTHSIDVPLSISNDFSNGTYKSIYFNVDKTIPQVIFTQKYTFSDLQFYPNPNSWLIGTVYWYLDKDITNIEYSTVSRIHVDVGLEFKCDNNGINYSSNAYDHFTSFDPATTNDVLNKHSIRWGRNRGIINLKDPNPSLGPFYGFVNSEIFFKVKIWHDHWLGDKKIKIYLNRPKLEWGGLPTPWTP